MRWMRSMASGLLALFRATSMSLYWISLSFLGAVGPVFTVRNSWSAGSMQTPAAKLYSLEAFMIISPLWLTPMAPTAFLSMYGTVWRSLMMAMRSSWASVGPDLSMRRAPLLLSGGFWVGLAPSSAPRLSLSSFTLSTT